MFNIAKHSDSTHSYNSSCNYQPQFIIHYHNKYNKHTLLNVLVKYFITIKLRTYLTVLTSLRQTQLLIDPLFANNSLFVYQTVWSSKKADSKVTCWASLRTKHHSKLRLMPSSLRIEPSNRLSYLYALQKSTFLNNLFLHIYIYIYTQSAKVFVEHSIGLCFCYVCLYYILFTCYVNNLWRHFNVLPNDTLLIFH